MGVVKDVKQVGKAYKELGHKKFMEKFKTGLMKVTPEQLLQVKLISLSGQALGLLLAAIMLFSFGTWYIGIPISFAFIFTVASLVEIYQQYNAMKRLNAQMGNLNELLGQ